MLVGWLVKIAIQSLSAAVFGGWATSQKLKLVGNFANQLLSSYSCLRLIEAPACQMVGAGLRALLEGGGDPA